MKRQVYEWKTLDEQTQKSLLLRPGQGEQQNTERSEKVASIIQQVRLGGDQSLIFFARKFDQVDLAKLVYERSDLSAAYDRIEEKLRLALVDAKKNIETFHKLQKPCEYRVETAPGIHCERRSKPIERVGLYVPGGSAPLVSAVLMLAIPAAIAGCKEKVLITPPASDGKIPDPILAAAHLCGLEKVICSGGAQAIAALAYGTESVPKVDKIYGPGNSWVTEAKLQVSSDAAGAAFDSPAGPSEVLVMIDDDSNPAFAAADLLSQAEHGPDSQVVLLSTSQHNIEKVFDEIESQLETLPRCDIAEQALKKSFFIKLDTMEDMLAWSNAYAPEHLIIHPDISDVQKESIYHAGSVFLGPYSPESVGDYASGTNHVLPTYGYARVYSGLSVDDFRKTISFQQLTKQGLLGIANTVEVLAEFEGLDAHKKAVSLRRISLEGQREV